MPPTGLPEGWACPRNPAHCDHCPETGFYPSGGTFGHAGFFGPFVQATVFGDADDLIKALNAYQPNVIAAYAGTLEGCVAIASFAFAQAVDQLERTTYRQGTAAFTGLFLFRSTITTAEANACSFRRLPYHEVPMSTPIGRYWVLDEITSLSCPARSEANC